MRSLTNLNARDLPHAVALAARVRAEGKAVSFSAGGSDLLQQIKDGVVQSDVLVNLRGIRGGRAVSITGDMFEIGGLITLAELSEHAAIRESFPAIAEAAESVATPQIRNVGTLAGNVCQRPWCWYYRQGFPCFKAGGNQCFSVVGENQLNAIFGGGPSYIVHPSDVAPALVAFDAHFHILGPLGPRGVAAADFFALPRSNPGRENVLGEDEILSHVEIPTPRAGVRSAYRKVMDREAWTHAVASVALVLEMNGEICRDARIVLGGVAPIPWRVVEAERLLLGQRMTADLARRVGEAAVAGARPLSKNAYKVALVRGLIERTLSESWLS